MMNYNVYGLMGIGVRNAMWNAGWDKLPKRDGYEIIKGSPYALQYCIKNQWNNRGEGVLGLKTMQECGSCSTLTQRYFDIFKEEDIKEPNKDKKESDEDYNLRCKKRIEKTRNNLLGRKDVLNFGIAYTGANSMSAKGVVQFTDGINKFENTNIIEEKILSPYGNPKSKSNKPEGEDEEKSNPTMNTNGTRYTTDEAHYVYDFSIFPKEYEKYICDGFEGYTESDYNNFKETSLVAVSNYNSKAKAGCKNEFAMFIEVKEEYNYQLDLNGLQDYVEVYRDDKVVYDLSKLGLLLNKISHKIKNIELYYNIITVDVKGVENIDIIKKYDLITREEI